MSVYKSKAFFKGQFVPSSYAKDEIELFNLNQDVTKTDYDTYHLNERKFEKDHAFEKWVTSASHTVSRRVSKGLHDMEKMMDNVELASLKFKELFKTKDNLVKHNFCSIVNYRNGKAYYGQSFISDGFFCFFHQGEEVKKSIWIRIPLASVVTVTKAGRKFHHDKVNGHRPRSVSKEQVDIIPLQGIHVKPSVLQVWTDKGEKYEFFGFSDCFDSYVSTLKERMEFLSVVDNVESGVEIVEDKSRSRSNSGR
eukprot:TRINITY_DN5669_c0_g1_i1.p1 TRINITY_DN5669_c0_g1~~TRINITY_DN5669_c0_g1_i1.p1  ORF type:complete len:252 (-),score=41.09 TRINITY_DN5669_c0_g1_i1:345-1100(-)